MIIPIATDEVIDIKEHPESYDEGWLAKKFVGENIFSVEDGKEFRFFDTVLQAVRDTLKGRKEAIIAGGAIRDLVMFGDVKNIKDIDVFILDVEKHEIPSLVREMMQAFPYGHSPMEGVSHYPERASVMWQFDVQNILKEPYKEALMESSLWPRPGIDYATYDNSLVIPSSPSLNLPIQIIASTAKDTRALFSTFDFRINNFSFDGNEVVYEGMKDRAISKMTMSAKQNVDPYYVMKRGFYLEEKFKKIGLKIRFDRDDVRTLAALLMLYPEAPQL